MIGFTVLSWSAWSPGIASAEDWERWAGGPRELALEGAPLLASIAPMQRRRFSRLSKMALEAAFGACPREQLAEVSTVFVSRHGELGTCAALLSDIAHELPLSPTSFSHSVHNTQSGLYSIATGNAQPTSSIAGMRDGFCAGLAEAFGLCERRSDRRALLVVADEPMPEVFAGFADERPAAFALALWIEMGEDGVGPGFAVEMAAARAARSELPQALAFLGWMLGDEESLALAFGQQSWRFKRR